MSLKKFATQVDESVLKDLKAYAKSADKSISRIVTDAVREHLHRVKVRPTFNGATNEIIDEHAELLKRLAR